MAGIALAAPEDRFKGATRDGYDRTRLIQMSDQMRFRGSVRDGHDRKYYVQTYDRDRFRGTGYDGFDMSKGYNQPVAVFGITFIFY